jgi:hypothetical protein
MTTLAQTAAPTPNRRLGEGLTFAMAVAAGIAVANIYYNQPMLGLIGARLPGPGGLAGFIPTATQLGYAAGPVPAGAAGRPGRAARRHPAAVPGAGRWAWSPPPWRPSAALTDPGLAAGRGRATVAQQIVPFAAHLARPERRGADGRHGDGGLAVRHPAEPHPGRASWPPTRLARDVLAGRADGPGRLRPDGRGPARSQQARDGGLTLWPVAEVAGPPVAASFPPCAWRPSPRPCCSPPSPPSGPSWPCL